MSSTIGTTVKDFREPQPRGVLWFDPLLLLAAVGLIACSVYVIGSATADDIDGQRYYYVYRQAAYGIVGITLMMLLSRFDYSRAREWKAGLYVTMIGAILVTYGLGFSARGSKR